ncbi:MAG: segregation and condensation protein A [Verrucomicrobiales bacterium]|jgi:segregation and condensation protein A
MTESEEYRVNLDIFEGPLDLLLYLIKRDEVDIYDISIARITKQYMDYLDTFKLLNINLAGEFIVMASNLMYLKSRELLPKHVQPPEEETEEDDPRWDLIRQLIEYKKFKDAAQHLGTLEEERTSQFAPHPEKPTPVQEEVKPLGDVGIFDLILAFQNVLKRFNAEEDLGEIIDDRWTVSDKIAHLLETVPPGESIKFSVLFEDASTKGEVIVTFLALLELMKMNHFRAIQSQRLGDIELHRNENL